MRAAVEKLRYVVAECAAYSDGCGPAFELSSLERGKLLVLTLAIHRVLEHETLVISIWGSRDGENWEATPLASFTPKHYCGLYSILLNLVKRTEIHYLRAQWKMQRWKNTTKQTMFDFHIAVEPSGARVSAPRIPSPGHRKQLTKAVG